MKSPYRELCYWPRWFYVLMAAIMIGLPVALFVVMEDHERWPALAPIPVVLAVLCWFSRLEIRADADGIAYGFLRASNFVPWARVKSLEPEDYRFTHYWGWGWRVGGIRDRGYTVLGYKRGVRLRFEDDRGREWSVFLSSGDPESVCRNASRSA